MRVIFLATLLWALPVVAAARDYDRVSDEALFLHLMGQGDLTYMLYNITVKVMPDGKISGDALGWPITGTWSWLDGYFCRAMNWGGDELPYNCQLVEQNGDLVRFTVDKGAGRAAALRIR